MIWPRFPWPGVQRSPVPGAVRPLRIGLDWHRVHAIWRGGGAVWERGRARFLRPHPQVATGLSPGAGRLLLVTVDETPDTLLDCERFPSADFDELVRYLRTFEAIGDDTAPSREGGPPCSEDGVRSS